MPVDDLSATRAFYLDILGFRPLARPGDRPENDSGVGGAWFDLGNGQMLHLAERTNDPRIPVQHFALSVTDVTAIAADLRAPNGQDFRFVVVTDPDQRRELARLYAAGFSGYGDEGSESRAHLEGASPEVVVAFERVRRSAGFLAAHMRQVPVLVVPCITWRIPTPDTLWQASMYGSVPPPLWSFMLACRMYRLGTAWTTGHLAYEKDAAGLLGIPVETVTQVALIPVAHVLDDPFRPGPRRPVDDFVRWIHW